MTTSYQISVPEKVTIPMEFYGNTPFLWGHLNGQLRLFLFDSGAQDIVLNSRYVDDEGAEKGYSGIGATGAPVTFQTQIESLSFGEWSFGAREVLAMNMQHIEEEYEVEFHGLIGFRQLIHFEWMVDYNRKYLQLVRQFNKKEHKLAGRVKTQYFSHLPSFEAIIAGEPCKLLLDTGAPEFVFDETKKDRISSAFTFRAHETLDGASPDKVPVEAGTLSGFQVGGLDFGPCELKFMDMTQMKKHMGDFDGIIGHGMLSQRPAIVSWSYKAIWFLEEE